MANRYFIWKNHECNGINPEWVEITGSQFFSFEKNKFIKRYFKRIDDGVEDGQMFFY